MEPQNTFGLTLVVGELAVCRFAPDAPLPSWALASGVSFYSRTQTRDETSIVCAAEIVPTDYAGPIETTWRALAVDGPLDFSLVGVLAQLLQPLADARIPVFVISTFDTDYILVNASRLADTSNALTAAGHRVRL